MRARRGAVRRLDPRGVDDVGSSQTAPSSSWFDTTVASHIARRPVPALSCVSPAPDGSARPPTAAVLMINSPIVDLGSVDLGRPRPVRLFEWVETFRSGPRGRICHWSPGPRLPPAKRHADEINGS